jgi:hypothetical protein
VAKFNRRWRTALKALFGQQTGGAAALDEWLTTGKSNGRALKLQVHQKPLLVESSPRGRGTCLSSSAEQGARALKR